MKTLAPLYVFILFSVSVFAVSGCGGGGGSSTPQTAIPLTTSDMRVYKQGDTLTATVSVRDTSTGETASGDVTITVAGIVQNPFGIDCRSVVFSGTLTGPSGTIAYSVNSLFYQDSNNSMYDCGEFDDTLGRYVFLTNTATSPNGVFMERKSPIQTGDITSGVVFLDDGSWYDCTDTVQGRENVSVPLGFYESYKVSKSCSFSDGTTMVDTVWTVPDIFDLKDSGIFDGFSIVISVKSTSFN